MPEHGIQETQDLVQATKNLQAALQDVRQAIRHLPRPAPVPQTEKPVGGPIFQALRTWRTEQARAQRMPPYVIASDAALHAIEAAKPTDLEQLKNLRGVGASKAITYGSDILQIVATANA